jgi:site-specific DNA-methyltransferase (adenine-specific)
LIKLYNDDCFNVLKNIDDNSVDLVLTDPPYGTTAIEWDNILDYEKVWVELDRIVKPKSNIIFFGSQPFTSKLITSKLDWFRYELIWNKNKCGSPGLAKIRPNKVHENIMVFSKKSGGTYNPIMEKGEPYKRFNPDGYGSGKNTHGYGFGNKKSVGSENSGTRYPKSILHASRNFSAQQTLHPTQKPTNLLNWLIMTYSNENDIVLDFTMGSGSTGVSCKLTNRKFIGVELEKEYYDIAEDRIQRIQDNTFEPLVTELDFQLTSQLPVELKTTPDKKHEIFKKNKEKK